MVSSLIAASLSDVKCLGEIHHRGFTFQSMQRAFPLAAGRIELRGVHDGDKIALAAIGILTN
jgi:hypothetical protein